MNRRRETLIGLGLWLISNGAAFSGTQEKPLEKWEAPPPSEETPEIKAKIDHILQLLQNSRSDVNLVLTNPEWSPLHAWPRFRAAIRTHARASEVTIVTPQEPGVRLDARVRVLKKDRSPLPGAMLYFYQTSARGGYGADAAHFQANSGDVRHARLFGYATTNSSGEVTIHTIRPGGYPDSTLPQHIHLHITPPEGSERVTEILFDDDPRLTPEMRKEAERERAVICTVNRDAQSRESVVAEFVLD